MRRSARDFLETVWPRIASWCGGGELKVVEDVTAAEMARMLDVQAGIDAWQVSDGAGVRGIASRVQYGTAYDSFTIRLSRPSGAETEWHKRIRALEHRDEGWICPFFTCQAYLDAPGGDLLSVGLVRTEDLFAQAWIDRHDTSRVKTSPTSERFLYLDWSYLQKQGVPVQYWSRVEEMTAGIMKGLESTL
jgi:hypothetical protein